MRYLWVFFFCLLACKEPSSPPNKQPSSSVHHSEILRPLHHFFEAASRHDYISMQAQCVEGFVFTENDEVWTLDQLITFMEPDKHKVYVQYQLSEINLKVKPPLAWVHFSNSAVMTEGDQKTNIEWKESAILRREKGRWLLFRIEAERLTEDSLLP